MDGWMDSRYRWEHTYVNKHTWKRYIHPSCVHWQDIKELSPHSHEHPLGPGSWFLNTIPQSRIFWLLLLLSHFSRIRLCVTPQTAAHQATLSLGFSRQEHWSGLPFPSPVHESEKWKRSHSVASDSLRPMDCSPPGFPVHGIFQARVPEWGAIALSEGILEKWFIPEPGLEKHQMSLAQLVVP